MIAVIDIDLPVQVTPSSTEGHFHLVIDKTMSWEDYKLLLYALARVGIIEKGYAEASIAKGFSAIRLPWVKKEKNEDEVMF